MTDNNGHVDGDDYTWAGPSYPAAPVLAEDNAALRARVAELEAWIAAVPSGALIDYYYGSEARSYDGRAATHEVGAWIRRLEDENAAALREARP